MPGRTATGAWAERVAEAVPFARRLPGFEALAGLAGALPPPPSSQPFSLDCRCGAVAAGMRSERERDEPCLQCGERHFVLPADVYPASPRRRVDAKKGTKPRAKVARPAAADTAAADTAAADTAAADTVAADTVAADTVAADTAAGSPASGPSASGASTAGASTADPGVSTPATVRVPRWSRWGAGVRRQATPLRLIAVGLAAVVTGTVWWSVTQSRQTAARVTVAEAPAAAAEALAEGQFTRAAERFGTLAAAYDTLGLSDAPRAIAARQDARKPPPPRASPPPAPRRSPARPPPPAPRRTAPIGRGRSIRCTAAGG